jgi:hypothetical protein
MDTKKQSQIKNISSEVMIFRQNENTADYFKLIVELSIIKSYN